MMKNLLCVCMLATTTGGKIEKNEMRICCAWHGERERGEGGMSRKHTKWQREIFAIVLLVSHSLHIIRIFSKTSYGLPFRCYLYIYFAITLCMSLSNAWGKMIHKFMNASLLPLLLTTTLHDASVDTIQVRGIKQISILWVFLPSNLMKR